MFINQTKHSIPTMQKANLYISNRFRFLFIAIVPPVFVLLGIVLIIAKTNLFFPVFLFVFAVISAVFFAFFFPIALKKLVARTFCGQESMITYTLREDSFDVTGQEGSEAENTEGELYAAITKCEEYSDMWILYRGDLVSVLEKSGMTEGTAEELNVFFAVKLGNRYLVRYKKEKKK